MMMMMMMMRKSSSRLSPLFSIFHVGIPRCAVISTRSHSGGGQVTTSELVVSSRIKEIEDRAQTLLLDHFDNIQIPQIEAEISSRAGSLRKLLWSFPFYAILLDVATFDDGRLENLVRQRLALDNIHRSEFLVWQSFVRMVHFTNMERCQLQNDFPYLRSSVIPVNHQKLNDSQVMLGFQSINDEQKARSLPFEASLLELETEATSLCHLLWDQRYFSSHRIPIPVLSDSVTNVTSSATVWNVTDKARSLGLQAMGFPLAGTFLTITINQGHLVSVESFPGNFSLLVMASSLALGAGYLAIGWNKLIKQVLKEYKSSQVFVIRNLRQGYRETVQKHLHSNCIKPLMELKVPKTASKQ